MDNHEDDRSELGNAIRDLKVGESSSKSHQSRVSLLISFPIFSFNMVLTRSSSLEFASKEQTYTNKYYNNGYLKLSLLQWPTACISQSTVKPHHAAILFRPGITEYSHPESVSS